MPLVFACGVVNAKDLNKSKTKEEQKPNGVVLSCLDSRVPVEIVFDQGIGDLFVVPINVKLGNLTSLLDKIQPAVQKVKSMTPKFDPNSYEHIDLVSEENVRQTVARIRRGTEVIRKLEADGKISGEYCLVFT